MNFQASPVKDLPRFGYGLVRVSTGDQARTGVSLAAQKANIERWAKTNRITIYQIFEVVGSGRNMEDHLEYRKLMRLLKSHRESQCCLVVNTVDRFSRNSVQGTSVLNSLLEREISFVSVNDGLFITATRTKEAQRFLQLIQAAETESFQIESRVRGANAYLASLGWSFGPVPFGQRVEWVNVNRDDEGLPPKAIRTFVPDKSQENIIDFVLLNYNYPEKVLKALGRRTFRGNRITEETVEAIRRYIVKHRKDQLTTYFIKQARDQMEVETQGKQRTVRAKGAPRDVRMSQRIPRNRTTRPVRLETLETTLRGWKL